MGYITQIKPLILFILWFSPDRPPHRTRSPRSSLPVRIVQGTRKTQKRTFRRYTAKSQMLLKRAYRKPACVFCFVFFFSLRAGRPAAYPATVSEVTSK